MDGVGTRLARGADVLAGVEVRRDLDDLVRRARVQRARVVGCDDRDRAKPELACGTEDAQRDLAAVRDEHLLHARHPRSPVEEETVQRPAESNVQSGDLRDGQIAARVRAQTAARMR